MSKLKFLLLLLLLPLCSVSTYAYDFEVDGIYYNRLNDGTLEVTHGSYSGAIVIPASVNGSLVTLIGDEAFDGCSDLTSVEIPISLTAIGNYAFRKCSNLTSITIPNSVTSIGFEAFRDCSGLTSATLGNSVTSIGEEAFFCCSRLTSVNIPNSVTSIGRRAFSNCLDLKSVNIPNSVTSIGEETFCSCRSLTSVNIPNSVTSIGSDAFCFCRSLTSVNIPNSVTSIGSGAFYYCLDLKSVTLGNSVTTIGDYAFYKSYSLESVTLGNSVTTIGDGAFSDCALGSVTIPESVTSIGYEAFAYCDLKLVTISSIEQLFNIAIGENAWGRNNIALYCNNQRVKEITVPGKIKVLKANTILQFQIDKIVLEDGVETIEKNAISDSKYSLSPRVLEIGKTVTKIEPLFKNVTLVKCHATTPPKINEGAFHGCSFDNEHPGVIVFDTPEMEDAYLEAPVWKDLMTSNLENTVEVTVENPGKLATEIIYAGSAPAKVVGLKVNGTLNDTDFEKMRINMTALINLDLSGLDFTSMPANVLNGKFQLESIKLPNNCTKIEEGAMMGCSGLTSITMPDKITVIGKNAFNDCSALTSLTLPTSLTEISESAFDGCSALRSVKFNSRLTAIGNRAFAHTSLSEIVLNYNLKKIGNEAFAGCALDQELELPETLEAIGSGAFQGQHITGHLSLPESVATVGVRAFAGTEISTLFLNSSLTELSEGVFADCQNLNTIYVPDNITAINSHAFSGCSSLANLRFSPTLTAIGTGAFKSSGLRTAILPKGITAIESETFDQCKNLRTASIPAGVTTLGDGAFRGCIALRNLTVKTVTPPTINSSVFLGVNTNLCLLAIPTVSFEDYALSNFWGRFVNMRNSIAVETVGKGTISFSSNDEGGAQPANAPARAPQLAASATDDEAAEAENGSTVYIPVGGMINFYITPAKDEEIISATLDGVDITDQIVNGVFTTTADKRNAKLVVNFSGDEGVKGDVNGDGIVTVTDVVYAVNIIMSANGTTNDAFEAADLNDDGNVTVTDVTIIVSIIMSNDNNPQRAPARSVESSDLVLLKWHASDESVCLSLPETGEWAAAQCDLRADGVDISDVRLSATAAVTHTMAAQRLPDGSIRCLVYSLSGKSMPASEALLEIGCGSLADAEVLISDIELTACEADGYRRVLVADILAGAASGIGAVDA